MAENQTPFRSPKKSETLEIRLDHAAKDAFMARCRTEGRTASEVVRGFIDKEAGRAPSTTTRSGLWQAGVAVLIGLAIGAVAAPTLAQSVAGAQSVSGGQSVSDSASDGAVFKQLDRDHDGVLSLDEFRRR